MGRTLRNAMLNLGMEENVITALGEVSFNKP